VSPWPLVGSSLSGILPQAHVEVMAPPCLPQLFSTAKLPPVFGVPWIFGQRMWCFRLGRGRPHISSPPLVRSCQVARRADADAEFVAMPYANGFD